MTPGNLENLRFQRFQSLANCCGSSTVHHAKALSSVSVELAVLSFSLLKEAWICLHGLSSGAEGVSLLEGNANSTPPIRAKWW